MTGHKNASALPQPSLACLTPLAAPDVLVAWVAAQPNGRCLPEAAVKFLAPVLPFDETLAEAKRAALVHEDDGFLFARQGAKSNGRGQSGYPGPDALRTIAVQAVKGQAAASPLNGSRRRRDLSALVLRQLYGLEELPTWPAAQQARCALLARIVASSGGDFGGCARQPLKAFKFDEMSRASTSPLPDCNGGLSCRQMQLCCPRACAARRTRCRR